MSKKLNETALVSELSGSAFFKPVAPPAKSKSPRSRKTARPSSSNPLPSATPPESNSGPVTNNQPYARTPVRTEARPPVRLTGRRIINRYAFEFFQDQLETLKNWSLQAQLRGEKGSMSQMVREALDAYITKRLNQTAEGTDDNPSARTPVRPDGGGEE